MKKIILYFATLWSLVLFFGCEQLTTQSSNENSKHEVHDLMSWLYYERDSIVWSGDYIPLNLSGKEISKDSFFTVLKTGNYYPKKIKPKNSYSIFLQLHLLPNSVNDELREVISRKSISEYSNYKMEGKQLSDFRFTDLNGNILDSKNCFNKILVLNCWFINCAPCVKEIPKLNELAARYKNHSNVKFLALAMDSKQELKQFVKKTPFKYQIIPNMEEYMHKKLMVTSYPMHFIVGGNGEILKVISGTKSDEIPPIINKALLQ